MIALLYLASMAATSCDYFDFQSSAAATSSALTETLAAESLTRVLYPHDSTSTACRRMGIGQIYLSAGGIQETSKVRTEKGVFVDTIRKNRQLLSVARR